jgi:pilus assembly protein CpaB
MFKRRGAVLVILSLVLGIGAAWAANVWVQQRLSTAGNNESLEVVVGAAMAIPYGTKVEGRHLRIVQISRDSAPENAFRSLEAVEGMVANVAIARGEILLKDRFSEHEIGSTLAALVQNNMRAVTVRVDDVVGVAGFLLPGNRVDIVATRMDRNSRRATAETILRNIRVLAVDQTASTDQNDPVIVRAVTLELSPKQSETLVKAKEEGRIQLTLRNPLDETEEIVSAPEAAPPAPVAAPAPAPVVRPRPAAPPQNTVTVIRGTKVGTAQAAN